MTLDPAVELICRRHWSRRRHGYCHGCPILVECHDRCGAPLDDTNTLVALDAAAARALDDHPGIREMPNTWTAPETVSRQREMFG